MSLSHARAFRGSPLTEDQADEIVSLAILEMASPEPSQEQRIVMRASVMLLVRMMLSLGWRIEPPDAQQ
jgi:hypothetical protein